MNLLKIGQNFTFVALELVVGSSECDIYLKKNPQKFGQKIIYTQIVLIKIC